MTSLSINARLRRGGLPVGATFGTTFGTTFSTTFSRAVGSTFSTTFSTTVGPRLCPRLGWTVVWALAALLGTPSAHAVLVTGPGGTAEQGRRLVLAAPVPGAQAQAMALVAARIDAVDAAGQTLTLRGKPVPVHPTALKVLGPQGQPLSGLRALRAGQPIRFALEAELPLTPLTPATPATQVTPASLLRPSASAAAPAERRIVLIYLDAQP